MGFSNNSQKMGPPLKKTAFLYSEKMNSKHSQLVSTTLTLSFKFGTFCIIPL